jgi:hypothetical protein
LGNGRRRRIRVEFRGMPDVVAQAALVVVDVREGARRIQQPWRGLRAVRTRCGWHGDESVSPLGSRVIVILAGACNRGYLRLWSGAA